MKITSKQMIIEYIKIFLGKYYIPIKKNYFKTKNVIDKFRLFFLCKVRSIVIIFLQDMDLIEFYLDLKYGIKYHDNFGKHSFLPWRKFSLPENGDIGIVFFCGLGDLLYGYNTLLWISRLIRNRGDKFYAYTLADQDNFNNPMLYKFLCETKIFDDVIQINGSPREYWKLYDWSQAIKLCSDKTHLFPYIYKTKNSIHHRITSVSSQFSLNNIQIDISFPSMVYSSKIKNIINSISHIEKIVILHCDSRSANYHYPYAKELVGLLNKRKYLVLSFTKIDCNSIDYYKYIDPNSLSVFETYQLLCSIPAPVIAINSIFWPLCMAAKKPLLGLHFLRSKDAHQFYFDKMFLFSCEKICVDKVKNGSVAIESIDYFINVNSPSFMIDFRPEAIVDRFERFL